MPYCPICRTEYSEEQGNCSNCKWDLSLVSVGDRTSEEVLEKAIASYKKIWLELTQLQAEQKTELLPATESHLEDLEKINIIVKEQVEKALCEKENQENNDINKILDDQKQLDKKITEIKNSKLDTSEFEKESKKYFDNQIKDYFDGQFKSWIIKELEKLNSELEKKINTSSNVNQESLNALQKRVEKVEVFQRNTQSLLDYNDLVNSPGSKTSTRLEGNQHSNNETSSYKLTVTTEELQLVENYNSGSFSLLEKIAEVSETQKSISDRSAGASQSVILEEKPRGMYEIVKEGTYHYLVPSKSFRITDSNYKTVEALFECRNYQKGYSERFELVQPAKVITLSGNQNWQLQEQGRGILEFKLDHFQFTKSAKVSL